MNVSGGRDRYYAQTSVYGRAPLRESDGGSGGGGGGTGTDYGPEISSLQRDLNETKARLAQTDGSLSALVPKVELNRTRIGDIGDVAPNTDLSSAVAGVRSKIGNTALLAPDADVVSAVLRRTQGSGLDISGTIGDWSAWSALGDAPKNHSATLPLRRAVDELWAAVGTDYLGIPTRARAPGASALVYGHNDDLSGRIGQWTVPPFSVQNIGANGPYSVRRAHEEAYHFLGGTELLQPRADYRDLAPADPANVTKCLGAVATRANAVDDRVGMWPPAAVTEGRGNVIYEVEELRKRKQIPLYSVASSNKFLRVSGDGARIYWGPLDGTDATTVALAHNESDPLFTRSLQPFSEDTQDATLLTVHVSYSPAELSGYETGGFPYVSFSRWGLFVPAAGKDPEYIVPLEPVHATSNYPQLDLTVGSGELYRTFCVERPEARNHAEAYRAGKTTLQLRSVPDPANMKEPDATRLVSTVRLFVPLLPSDAVIKDNSVYLDYDPLTRRYKLRMEFMAPVRLCDFSHIAVGSHSLITRENPALDPNALAIGQDHTVSRPYYGKHVTLSINAPLSLNIGLGNFIGQNVVVDMVRNKEREEFYTRTPMLVSGAGMAGAGSLAIVAPTATARVWIPSKSAAQNYRYAYQLKWLRDMTTFRAAHTPAGEGISMSTVENELWEGRVVIGDKELKSSPVKVTLLDPTEAALVDIVFASTVEAQQLSSPDAFVLTFEHPDIKTESGALGVLKFRGVLVHFSHFSRFARVAFFFHVNELYYANAAKVLGSARGFGPKVQGTIRVSLTRTPLAAVPDGGLGSTADISIPVFPPLLTPPAVKDNGYIIDWYEQSFTTMRQPRPDGTFEPSGFMFRTTESGSIAPGVVFPWMIQDFPNSQYEAARQQLRDTDAITVTTTTVPNGAIGLNVSSSFPTVLAAMSSNIGSPARPVNATVQYLISAVDNQAMMWTRLVFNFLKSDPVHDAILAVTTNPPVNGVAAVGTPNVVATVSIELDGLYYNTPFPSATYTMVANVRLYPLGNSHTADPAPGGTPATYPKEGDDDRDGLDWSVYDLPEGSGGKKRRRLGGGGGKGLWGALASLAALGALGIAIFKFGNTVLGLMKKGAEIVKMFNRARRARNAVRDAYRELRSRARSSTDNASLPGNLTPMLSNITSVLLQPSPGDVCEVFFGDGTSGGFPTDPSDYQFELVPEWDTFVAEQRVGSDIDGGIGRLVQRTADRLSEVQRTWATFVQPIAQAYTINNVLAREAAIELRESVSLGFRMIARQFAEGVQNTASSAMSQMDWPLARFNELKGKMLYTQRPTTDLFDQVRLSPPAHPIGSAAAAAGMTELQIQAADTVYLRAIPRAGNVPHEEVLVKIAGNAVFLDKAIDIMNVSDGQGRLLLPLRDFIALMNPNDGLQRGADLYSRDNLDDLQVVAALTAQIPRVSRGDSLTRLYIEYLESSVRQLNLQLVLDPWQHRLLQDYEYNMRWLDTVVPLGPDGTYLPPFSAFSVMQDILEGFKVREGSATASAFSEPAKFTEYTREILQYTELMLESRSIPSFLSAADNLPVIDIAGIPLTPPAEMTAAIDWNHAYRPARRSGETPAAVTVTARSTFGLIANHCTELEPNGNPIIHPFDLMQVPQTVMHIVPTNMPLLQTLVESVNVSPLKAIAATVKTPFIGLHFKPPNPEVVPWPNPDDYIVQTPMLVVPEMPFGTDLASGQEVDMLVTGTTSRVELLLNKPVSNLWWLLGVSAEQGYTAILRSVHVELGGPLDENGLSSRLWAFFDTKHIAAGRGKAFWRGFTVRLSVDIQQIQPSAMAGSALLSTTARIKPVPCFAASGAVYAGVRRTVRLTMPASSHNPLQVPLAPQPLPANGLSQGLTVHSIKQVGQAVDIDLTATAPAGTTTITLVDNIHPEHENSLTLPSPVGFAFSGLLFNNNLAYVSRLDQMTPALQTTVSIPLQRAPLRLEVSHPLPDLVWGKADNIITFRVTGQPYTAAVTAAPFAATYRIFIETEDSNTVETGSVAVLAGSSGELLRMVVDLSEYTSPMSVGEGKYTIILENLKNYDGTVVYTTFYVDAEGDVVPPAAPVSDVVQFQLTTLASSLPVFEASDFTGPLIVRFARPTVAAAGGDEWSLLSVKGTVGLDGAADFSQTAALQEDGESVIVHLHTPNLILPNVVLTDETSEVAPNTDRLLHFTFRNALRQQTGVATMPLEVHRSRIRFYVSPDLPIRLDLTPGSSEVTNRTVQNLMRDSMHAFATNATRPTIEVVQTSFSGDRRLVKLSNPRKEVATKSSPGVAPVNPGRSLFKFRDVFRSGLFLAADHNLVPNFYSAYGAQLTLVLRNVTNATGSISWSTYMVGTSGDVFHMPAVFAPLLITPPTTATALPLLDFLGLTVRRPVVHTITVRLWERVRSVQPVLSDAAIMIRSVRSVNADSNWTFDTFEVDISAGNVTEARELVRSSLLVTRQNSTTFSVLVYAPIMPVFHEVTHVPSVAISNGPLIFANRRNRATAIRVTGLPGIRSDNLTPGIMESTAASLSLFVLQKSSPENWRAEEGLCNSHIRQQIVGLTPRVYTDQPLPVPERQDVLYVDIDLTGFPNATSAQLVFNVFGVVSTVVLPVASLRRTRLPVTLGNVNENRITDVALPAPPTGYTTVAARQVLPDLTMLGTGSMVPFSVHDNLLEGSLQLPVLFSISPERGFKTAGMYLRHVLDSGQLPLIETVIRDGSTGLYYDQLVKFDLVGLKVPVTSSLELPTGVKWGVRSQLTSAEIAYYGWDFQEPGILFAGQEQRVHTYATSDPLSQFFAGYVFMQLRVPYGAVTDPTAHLGVLGIVPYVRQMTSGGADVSVFITAELVRHPRDPVGVYRRVLIKIGIQAGVARGQFLNFVLAPSSTATTTNPQPLLRWPGMIPISVYYP